VATQQGMGLFPQWYPWDSVAGLAHSDAVGSNIVPSFECVESIMFNVSICQINVR